MIRLDVQDRDFHIQFRHTRNLSPALGVQAITTCVIVAVRGLDPVIPAIEFTAIGNTLCWNEDNFSRRRGRLKAFANALDHCAPLMPVSLDLFRAYMALDPDPPPRVKPPKLPPEEKRARWERGWELRQQRAEARIKQQARQNWELAIARERAEGQS